MTTIASQITSLTSVYSTVYSDADQRKHQSSASLAFVWGIHRDRWIPRTKGQLRGKCFHLMTSSWSIRLFTHILRLHSDNRNKTQFFRDIYNTDSIWGYKHLKYTATEKYDNNVMSVRNLGVIFTQTWKWIYKFQKPAKTLAIISTTSGESENPSAKTPRTRLYIHVLQATLTFATVWLMDYQGISSRNSSICKTQLQDWFSLWENMIP